MRSQIATGILVTSTAQQSQMANRKDVLTKLNFVIAEIEQAHFAKQTNVTYNLLFRRNPVKIYEGECLSVGY